MWGRWPAGLGAALLWAGLALPAQSLSPPVITKPDWITKPTGENLLDYYPPAALEAALPGSATIGCDVTREGSLVACQVIAEDPAGQGFGAATVALAGILKMTPQTVNGQPTDDGKVRFTVRWNVAIDDPDNET